jgi:Cu(I)/Ag(I) efflux system membrane fusion protein
MDFRLADPAMVRGYKAGDRVRFSFDQGPGGPIVRSLAQQAAR